MTVEDQVTTLLETERVESKEIVECKISTNEIFGITENHLGRIMI